MQGGENQYLALWAAVLVSRRIWKSVSLEFMTKGPHQYSFILTLSFARHYALFKNAHPI
jgi:hypothetical protein